MTPKSADSKDSGVVDDAPSTEGAAVGDAVSSSGRVDEQQRAFRVAALDLDGTLLRSNHELSSATRDYLLELDRRGFTIVIATGRSATTVYEHVAALNFPHPIPVVCSNGARGCLMSVEEVNSGRDSGDGTRKSSVSVSVQELFATPVPHCVARTTIALSKKLGHVSQYYVDEDVYADPREPHHFELTEMYKRLTGCKTVYVEDMEAAAVLERGLPSKQLVLCRPEEQDATMEAFEAEFLSSSSSASENAAAATIVRGSMGWFLEVLHPEVNKGMGLSKLCDQHLNIGMEHVVAFGDGDNDLEFLQMAGRGIVMKNGRDVVKEIADQVIDYTNDDDGVIRTLQQMKEDGLLIFSTETSSSEE